MWEYESDEEIGEDLGITAPESGDLDVVAAGELDAGAGAAKTDAAATGEKKE